MAAPCPLAVPQLGGSAAGHDPVPAALPAVSRLSAAAAGHSWLGQWKFQGMKLLSCGKHLPHHPASLEPQRSEPLPARAMPWPLASGHPSASPASPAAPPRVGTITCGYNPACPGCAGPRRVLAAPPIPVSGSKVGTGRGVQGQTWHCPVAVVPGARLYRAWVGEYSHLFP